MPPTDEEKQQQWIAAWRSAGPELERIRNKELSELSDEQATLQATFLGIANVAQPLPESGVYELQQWMMRWRRKLEQAK